MTPNEAKARITRDQVARIAERIGAAGQLERNVVEALDWLLAAHDRHREIVDRARIVVLERDDATDPTELGAWGELADLLSQEIKG